MNNKVILCGFFFLAVIIGGCTEKQLTEDDFKIISLEYASFDSEANSGTIKLVVDTKVDNIRISASSEGKSCVNECTNAGECIITSCRSADGGKFHTSFGISDINKDHKFNICITRGNSACKEILLPAYEQS